ncbi:hypothetical protein [Xanthocytophaga agilis]|uniref:Uncharacterized protein n=1 Tax=Xanthocytophaga agilis TaxID=3048010 RepID=A0AAE3R365_9BACT|nr:hypothetical protein [Xanthocytophaga agilis]MDJ1500499.1 hypothetical protein [Xanthocytophaga agilis]
MITQNLELASDVEYLRIMLLPIENGELKLPNGWSNMVISRAAEEGYTQSETGMPINTVYVSLVKRRIRFNRYLAKLINQIAKEYTESLALNEKTTV